MPAPNSIAPSRATPTCSGSGRSRVKERNSIPTSVPLPMVSASQANQPCVAPPSPDPRSGEIVSASVRASVAQAVASVAASPNTRATLRRTPKIRAASATAPGPDAAATVPRASTAGGRRPRSVDENPEHHAQPNLVNCLLLLKKDPEATIRRFAELLDIDYERVRLWMFARSA